MIARLIAAFDIWIFRKRMAAGNLRPCSRCIRHIFDTCAYTGQPTHIARRDGQPCGIVGRLWEGKTADDYVSRETLDERK